MSQEQHIRTNATIGELEAQRNILSVRATQLAAELAVERNRANITEAKCAELQQQLDAINASA